jgi:hypothetical protein
LAPAAAAATAGAPTLTLICFGLASSRFGNMQCQDAVLIVGLDRFRVDGVGQLEAASERPIGTFNSQVVAVVHLLLEFPLATNGQYIIFYADVEILGINVRQIRFYDQFLFGF